MYTYSIRVLSFTMLLDPLTYWGSSKSHNGLAARHFADSWTIPSHSDCVKVTYIHWQWLQPLNPSHLCQRPFMCWSVVICALFVTY